MNSCRFCESKDKVLFAFTLQLEGISVHTYVCKNCMELLREDKVTINICLYCGNIFLINEPSNDSVLLLPQCGICEKSNQDIKYSLFEKEEKCPAKKDRN